MFVPRACLQRESFPFLDDLEHLLEINFPTLVFLTPFLSVSPSSRGCSGRSLTTTAVPSWLCEPCVLVLGGDVRLICGNLTVSETGKYSFSESMSACV